MEDRTEKQSAKQSDLTATQTNEASTDSLQDFEDGPSSEGTQPSIPKRRNLRLVLLTILVTIPMFFEGCENGQVRFTMGTPPFARLTHGDGDGNWLGQFVWIDFWLLGFLAHFGLLVGLMVWLSYDKSEVAKNVRDRLTHGSVWMGIVFATFVVNSFCYIPPVWIYGVLYPLTAIIDEKPSFAYHVYITRLHYVCLILLFSAVFYAMHWIYRKRANKERWWQISFGTTVAVTVILGTLAGVIGRVFLSDQLAD